MYSGQSIEVLLDPFGGLRVIDTPRPSVRILPSRTDEDSNNVGGHRAGLRMFFVRAEHQRHQRRASTEPSEVKSEDVDPLGLSPFVPEDAAVDERLSGGTLADDTGLFIIHERSRYT